MRTQTVAVCTERRLHWIPGSGQQRCGNPNHDHRLVEVHQHLDRVVLPGGAVVTAVSFTADEPYGRDRRPDFGLYLDRRWSPPWPHDHIQWPDFGVPADPWLSVAPSVVSCRQLGPASQSRSVAWVGTGGLARPWPAWPSSAAYRPTPPSNGCETSTAFALWSRPSSGRSSRHSRLPHRRSEQMDRLAT